MQFHLVTLLSPILRPQAYLDPGSGSIILQFLIAAIAGAALLVKIYWKKIKGLFNRSKENTETISEAPKEDDTDIQQ